MQRKQFNAIAKAMAACTNHAIYKESVDARSQHALACNELAIECAKHNSNFDRIRFLLACGLSETDAEAL